MKKVSDEDFIDAFKRLGSPDLVAKTFGLNLRGVYTRRDNIEKKFGIILASHSNDRTGRTKVNLDKIGGRSLLNLTGTVIIGSDLHAWPGERSLAFRAFLQLIKDLKPTLVVMNGDAFDGARISRHPPGEWAQLPTVADELDAVKECLWEIEHAAPKGTPLHWTFGNHDSRYSARLAQVASEFQGIAGFDLPDHFPAWTHSWSLLLNGKVMVKHRLKGGVHAAHNNTLTAGMSMVTGHLHSLKVSAYSDYNGTRYGVDCGTLSDFGPDVGKFFYTEDAPVNWRSGFCVLTFDKSGFLQPPELCEVSGNNAYFRGQVVMSR